MAECLRSPVSVPPVLPDLKAPPDLREIQVPPVRWVKVLSLLKYIIVKLNALLPLRIHFPEMESLLS